MKRPLAAFALLLAACGETLSPTAPPGPRALEESHHEFGRAVYNFRCYFCHGYSGDARTLAATYLTPPPRNFARTDAGTLTADMIYETVRFGRPGTAMAPFGQTLSDREMRAVADFVFKEFVVEKQLNTRYHTAANGWPDHERHRAAFPFATGEIALDAPWETLTPEQAQGKRLFLQSCVSCHDRSRVADEGPAWDPRPVSFPRGGFVPGSLPPVDAMASATPFARHDIPPRMDSLTPQESAGEALFQANCAFCHAADGTGKNWIGQFMEPHARDLTDPEVMRGMTPERLAATIGNGLPGTSMPAWKHVLDDGQIAAVVAYVQKAFIPRNGAN
ncbi:MAG TPA: c-type cytochrome [Pelomicrobium sp.]|nr:c-type cytochrome [Pelomicrobium sp.]